MLIVAVKVFLVIDSWPLLFQTPGEGNWIHIQFQNKLQAKRAISKSGKVFGGKIMVGVTQCIDRVRLI